MLAADGQITPQLKSIEIYVKGLKVRTRTTQPLEPFEHVLIKPNESWEVALPYDRGEILTSGVGKTKAKD